MIRFFLLYSFLLICNAGLNQQIFNANVTSSPVDLTGANGTCGTPGASSPNSFTFNVSGVGVLSPTNALSKITICFANCVGSYNLNLVAFRIMAPNGTCIGVYDGGLGTSYPGVCEFSLVSSTSCLNPPNASNMPSGSNPSGFNSSSNSGIFSSTFGGSGVNFTSSFNGLNADGIWRIIFSESTISEPCLQSASLTFANPSVTDQTGNGNNCSNPIVWNGGPICASTNGMSSSTQMPGWAGPGGSTFGTFNGGTTCAWNGANNNDVWIQFVAQTNNLCINLSGLDNNQQSVVVSDSNLDGDNNPCTGSGAGQYWNLVSCPDPGAYTTTAGTTINQNHCFSATVGQTYFLVVDGNGGLESPFYISGITGTIFNLPIELVFFGASIKGQKFTSLSWRTATERNNDYFIVQRSHDGVSWELLEKVNGAGNSVELLSYETYDFNPYPGSNYYRLKQVDFDGKSSYSEIRSVYNPAELRLLQNPSNGIFGVGGMPKHQENVIQVMDLSGKQLQEHLVFGESFELDLTDYHAGMYLVTVNETETIKIIKE